MWTEELLQQKSYLWQQVINSVRQMSELVILQLLTYATSYNMLPAIRDLNVPVVPANVQKKKAPDYEHTDTATLAAGELYACGAVGAVVAGSIEDVPERDMLLLQAW